MTPANVIPRQSLASAVAEKLREKILSGAVQEGEPLLQDRIAEEMGVSRIPVREALRQLEAEGLISIVPHHGAVVTALAPEEIEELFQIRALLECDMLGRAVPRLTDDDFRRAEQVLAEYEQALAHEEEVGRWGELNWRFHSALYGAADQPLHMALLRTLNNNCDRYTRLHLLVMADRPHAGAAHRRILDICRTGDADAARGALHRHITEAGRYLREFIIERRAQTNAARA